MFPPARGLPKTGAQAGRDRGFVDMRPTVIGAVAIRVASRTLVVGQLLVNIYGRV
jgi:hypothetical protein